MAFASLYVGDSQTMAAEAGILGTPFVRFNDFVGRISYLAELEDKYQLGFGIKPDNPDLLISTIKNIVNKNNIKEDYSIRRRKMLEEKIDVAKFMTWFIENYPKSLQIMDNNHNYQHNFR